MQATPTVLFLCPHNALRSVIAGARVERLLEELDRGRA